jgi:indole-3-glycerol phosphate synthase
MSDVLKRICVEKLEHVARCKRERSLAALQREVKDQDAPRGFTAALAARAAKGEYGLIAEIKKASPSKGLIRTDFDPPSLARAYDQGGATCLSVLTDEPYFQGKDSYLTSARQSVALPVLRKDFMLDPYQVVEARCLGADCILLIMAALEDSQAAELESAAIELDMDVLVEVHDEAEMARAHILKSRLVGVNNRNLKTLDVDLATGEALIDAMPAGALGVCESGLNTPADLERMNRRGYYCFLVGESLMRQDDVAAATAALLTRGQAAAAGG